MVIRFYGVRGSIPTPLLSTQIQSKISAVVQRIQKEDLESQDSRERFIYNLPKYLYGSVGGNTACVELKTEKSEIILDAGSGLRVLGKQKRLKSIKHFNFFISHFHYDHIQGLPFFDPIFDNSVFIDFYSGYKEAENYLINQQIKPYFPVTFDSLTPNINFFYKESGSRFTLDNLTVSTCKMRHPGGSFSYSFSENGVKFTYATDIELTPYDFNSNEALENVFQDATVLVLDSQYTVQEFYKKASWGHSSFCYAVDFAVHWNVKNLYLFHHEPTYDDKKLASLLDAARWYARYVVHSNINIYLATEGEEVTI